MACQGTSSTSSEFFSVIKDSDDEHEEAEHEDQEAVGAEVKRRYPDRGRKLSRWLEDYVADSDFDE